MTAPLSERGRLIRRIHARAREVGLDNNDRRDLQIRLTGVPSCADMSVDQLRQVDDQLRDRSARRPVDRVPPRLPGSRKLLALWISGWNLGVIRDRTDAGLAAWVRRQTGYDAANWSSPAELSRAIEALQAWLAREAEIDWRPFVAIDKHGRVREIARPRVRVIEAQWRILHRLGVVKILQREACDSWAARAAGLPYVSACTDLTDDQADEVIRNFGRRIRKARRN